MLAGHCNGIKVIAMIRVRKEGQARGLRMASDGFDGLVAVTVLVAVLRPTKYHTLSVAARVVALVDIVACHATRC